MTTSTVYTTKIYTVTSCAPTVTNCPGKGKVTTEIISLYTTVCPVSAPAPSSTLYSTIYSTKTYTISSCAAEVTNCPYGSKTTTVVPVTTSVVVVPTGSPAPVTTPATTPAPVTPTKSAVGTVTSASKTSSTVLQVTAAAGRLANSVEIAMAAAGVVAAFL